ncbi:MAG: 6-phospho-beta-glucosidase [Oscillospiraceae bacterium]|nr:6-phospho-beta-glucosidase [Oscillospiraceae bacterium]
MKKLKIAVIGAGSAYTPELIEGLINRKEILPVTDISLMDIDKRKLDIVGSLSKRMLDRGGLGCNFSITGNLDDALLDADFVFVQIRVGKLPARVLDEKIPLKYNLIGQETTGIGGFFKALRTIPVLMDISGKMRKLCPDAWMINFSNPSGICGQALLNYTETKMIGLCNGPIGMLNIPVWNLGFEKTDSEVEYIGLNHLGYVTSIINKNDGRDYLKDALNGDEEILNKLGGAQGHSKEIIKLAGGIPSSYLNYFYRPGYNLKKLLESKTSRGEDCIEIEERLLAMYQDANLYVKPEELSKRGGAMYSEIAVSLAESLWTDNKNIHIVNILNNGAVDFMENDDVIEIGATVGRDSAVPVSLKNPVSRHIKSMMRTVKTYERYTVEAALTGSRDDAIRALMSNPLIGDTDKAKACFEEMLEAHKDYLQIFYNGSN